MKGNKGITLIALVITIIVLLILAGVSIAMLNGDNSILGRAKSTVSANELGEGKDQVALTWNAAYADYLDKYYTGKLGESDTLLSLFKAEIAKLPKDKFTAEVSSDDKKVTVTSKSDSGVSASADITITDTTGAASSGKLEWK